LHAEDNGAEVGCRHGRSTVHTDTIRAVIEIAVACVAGAIGFWSGRRLRRRGRRPVTVAAFRALARPEAAYRESAEPEVVRGVPEVVASLRAAGLPVRERAAKLVIARGRESMELSIRDAGRVTLASLDIRERGGGTLIFEVALALLPVFGALTVTEATFGTFVVDGSRDHLAIEEERKERIREIARSLAENTREKLAVWRKALQ
jgi:hypothetical protein